MLKLIDKIWVWGTINWPICLIWIGGITFILTVVLTVIAIQPDPGQ